MGLACTLIQWVTHSIKNVLIAKQGFEEDYANESKKEISLGWNNLIVSAQQTYGPQNKFYSEAHRLRLSGLMLGVEARVNEIIYSSLRG